MLILTLLFPVFPKLAIGGTNQHIARYSQFVENHHDNIDDTSEKHLHTHKHSRDGEEHEHEHEHKLGVHSETRTMYSPDFHHLNRSEVEQSVCFAESHLISDPHVVDIFRPPRA